MTLHAITVLGHDRPGIIAQTTGILADLGLNLEDSTMTLLRGHFAMMLIGEGDALSPDIEAALVPLTEDGTLTVTVREVPPEQVPAVAGTSWLLTVHGGDRPGIVSSVCSRLAEVGGNITDLSTRLAGDLYLLVAEVDLPPGVDGHEVRTSLQELGDGLGVAVSMHEVEADEL